MKIFTEHIVSLGRVVAVLFFIASSGFTTVIHLCAMQASGCCDMEEVNDHRTCEEQPMAMAGQSVQGQFQCHQDIVAGGLSGVQALFEKDQKVQQSRSDCIAFIDSFIFPEVVAGASSFLTDFHSAGVSPPTVEKYIVNSTFLI